MDCRTYVFVCHDVKSVLVPYRVYRVQLVHQTVSSGVATAHETPPCCRQKSPICIQCDGELSSLSHAAEGSLFTRFVVERNKEPWLCESSPSGVETGFAPARVPLGGLATKEEEFYSKQHPMHACPRCHTPCGQHGGSISTTRIAARWSSYLALSVLSRPSALSTLVLPLLNPVHGAQRQGCAPELRALGLVAILLHALVVLVIASIACARLVRAVEAHVYLCGPACSSNSERWVVLGDLPSPAHRQLCDPG
jgi:hypothetical protein